MLIVLNVSFVDARWINMFTAIINLLEFLKMKMLKYFPSSFSNKSYFVKFLSKEVLILIQKFYLVKFLMQ